MSGKLRRKQSIDRVPFGGFPFGQSSLDQKLIPRGAAKSLRNLRPYGNILVNRNAWKTISNGFTSSNEYTWSSTVKDVGYFREFVRADSGKLAIFEERLFYDSDADTDDFDGGGSIDADTGQSFMGGFYVAATFYVFSREKVYSVNIGAGTKTAVVDFSTDIGDSYDDVTQMFNRYGETWAVSSKFSRLFFSDSGVIEVGNGAVVDDEAIATDFGIWQRLENAVVSETATAPLVEYLTYKGIQAFPYSGEVVTASKNYCYTNSSSYSSVFSNGDTIYVQTGLAPGVIYSDPQVIESSSDLTITLDDNATAGLNSIKISIQTDKEQDVLFRGLAITLSDDLNSEPLSVGTVIPRGGYYEIATTTALANSYTTAANAKITASSIKKVIIVDVWSVDVLASSNAFFAKGTWSTAVLDTDYLFNFDPDNDETVDGNIKLIRKYDIQNSRQIRVTYTPYTNPWIEGNAAYLDVSKEQGKIVEVIDTRAGLYIFKENPGSIWLLTGEPGPNGTPGSLNLIPIYSGGITAIEGTIQGTRSGIYFSALDVNKVDTYFFPLSQQKVDAIPKLSDIHQPTVTSQLVKAKSAIVHGDMYLLTLYTITSTTDDYPNDYDYSYLCQAYFADNQWKGRWYEWEKDQETEYVVDNPSAVVNATPRTIGYYEFDGNLFRVYALPTVADANEKTFELARYGLEDGHESPVDNIKMQIDSSIVTYDDGFYMDVETGWFSMTDVDTFTVRKLIFDLMASAGECEVTFYKDLNATAFLTKTATAMSDVAGSERFMRDLDVNFNCQYLKIRLRFKDVDSASSEEFVQIRDMALNVSVKSPRGDISQANIFS